MKIQVKNADSNPKKRLIVSKDTSQTISCLIALLILIVLFSVMSPYFLSSDNLANVLTQIITTALLGFGMTYVIISGEIDLSIAPTLPMIVPACSKIVPMINVANNPIAIPDNPSIKIRFKIFMLHLPFNVMFFLV